MFQIYISSLAMLERNWKAIYKIKPIHTNKKVINSSDGRSIQGAITTVKININITYAAVLKENILLLRRTSMLAASSSSLKSSTIAASCKH